MRQFRAEGERPLKVPSLPLFDPVFTDQLVELGYDDACAQWEKIENFLGDGARRQGTVSGGED